MPMRHPMRSSLLLRLADLGILPRRFELITRERRFREFWDEVADGTVPTINHPDSVADAQAGIAGGGEASSSHHA
jgi:hypothetical protein